MQTLSAPRRRRVTKRNGPTEQELARVRVITSTRSHSRPDRLALWAVLMGVFLVLAAATGANAATKLGDRALKSGMEGRDVRHLQLRLKHLGVLDAAATAHYGTLTKRAVRRYQRSHCLTADGVVGAQTVQALRSNAPRCRRQGGMYPHMATWYGPGLYGQRTACGHELTTRLRGVAHKFLPCGTRVRFTYEGRTRTFQVVDRGPYTKGIVFDLTAAAARSLGMESTGRIFASI